MNICIDQGNSRTKAAIFNGDGLLIKNLTYKTFSSKDVERLFSLYPLKNSIISSVVNIEPSIVNTLHRLSQRFILFDHQTPVPIQNNYESPQTLGQDRLAAAVGARTICNNENLLIIDIGSAITYDYVSQSGHYLGGNIAPGIKMRLQVLHQMTTKLPLLEIEDNELIPLFGKTTHDAIAAGVLRGVIFEVKGYMRTLSERVEHFQTFLTGGHSTFILNYAYTTDIIYEKHLVLKGLNQILCYNM